MDITKVDWDWTSVLSTLVIALFFIAFLWKKRKPTLYEENEPVNPTSKCSSPTCMRCHLHDQKAIKEVLLEKAAQYAELAGENTESILDYLDAKYPRVLSTFQSIDRKDDILRSVYENSGCKIELSTFEHHIWTFPGVRQLPFWCKENVIPQTSIDHLHSVALADYKRALKHKSGWKVNSVPTGTWRLYQLYDQGTKSEQNCVHCPETVSIIEGLSNFMKDVTFGNAMFSVLEPGSHIEAHCGPCNFRLRCHLAISVPQGCRIEVGTCVNQWRVGQLMVFDDSLVHRVWSDANPSSSSSSEDGATTSSERVVLIFDVWHPDVAEHEKAMIKHAFSL